MSDRTKIVTPRLPEVFEPSERRGDPGLFYWASAAALATALITPVPFFWAPPIWIAMLLAHRPPYS